MWCNRSSWCSTSSLSCWSWESAESSWISSMFPRAMVTGVRMACAVSRRNARCRSRRELSRAASSSTRRWAAADRSACQAPPPTMSVMSGISDSSSQVMSPARYTRTNITPVITVMAARAAIVVRADHMR